MINIYSDEHQSTLKYLKDTKANICNILVIAGDFNIRNRDWDFSYSFHLTHSDSLTNIADSFDLKLLCSIQQVPTCYANNANNANSVIGLLFLYLNSIEINNHNILPELYYPSDHISLTVDISIAEEFIQDKHQTIIRNSNKENNFILDLIKVIENINTMTIPDKESLELIVQEYTRISESIWYKHSHYVNITKCSKAWWNKKC